MGRPKKKRKPGERTASGRKADRSLKRVEACEGVLRRQQLYAGTSVTKDGEVIKVDFSQTFDALGRAYSAGLLGEGEEAKQLLNAGRTIAARYWSAYGYATPDSLAKFQPSTASVPIDDAVAKAREVRLAASLDRARATPAHRNAFDALVIDLNPDCGPGFLDRLILGEHPRPSDLETMRLALDALKMACKNR